MVNVKMGKCDVCHKREELTQHEVIEAPKDEKGRVRAILICDSCHKFYNLYRNALIANKIEIDRAKLES